ncbi:MAG TPA: glycosyl transferase group 1 [Bacteroidales bacterium]|nr:glycosyl transferase group 1 [Bacteroidales bacterium]
MAKKRIYLAVTNDLVTDNRVHKVATTLLKSEVSVTLIGRNKSRNTPALNRPYNTIRFNLLFKKGPYFYLEYNIRLFLFLLFHRFDIIVANDLDTLLGSFLASKLKSKKIVYDSHEYFTEVPELFNRKFPKKVWTFIERLILPKIKYACTVSESIAITYNKLYHIDLKIVRNVPNFRNKEETQINNTTKQILYQGSLNIGRGLEQMIDAMEFTENCELVIIGDGDITNQLKERIQSKNLNHKVTLKGRIPFESLMKETLKADLGIALEENLGLNYYYALPNKLFDYIQAGVPVLVSPFPEMQKIVNKYEIGTVYDHKSPQELAKTINEIFELKNRYQKWKDNTAKAAQELCWENEEKILIQLYKQAGLVF